MRRQDSIDFLLSMGSVSEPINHLNSTNYQSLDKISYLFVCLFRFIFARGKHLVAAFESSTRLLELWDIESALIDSSSGTTCFSSPCWSIRLGGRLGNDHIIPEMIFSTQNEFQMIFYGANGREVIARFYRQFLLPYTVEALKQLKTTVSAAVICSRSFYFALYTHSFEL